MILSKEKENLIKKESILGHNNSICFFHENMVYKFYMTNKCFEVEKNIEKQFSLSIPGFSFPKEFLQNEDDITIGHTCDYVNGCTLYELKHKKDYDINLLINMLEGFEKNLKILNDNNLLIIDSHSGNFIVNNNNLINIDTKFFEYQENLKMEMQYKSILNSLEYSFLFNKSMFYDDQHYKIMGKGIEKFYVNVMENGSIPPSEFFYQIKRYLEYQESREIRTIEEYEIAIANLRKNNFQKSLRRIGINYI